MTTTQAFRQLDKLEKKLLKLKKDALLNFDKKPLSLRGFLKDIKITEKDIKATEKSLFKKVGI